jgi:hypothetical protein
MSNSRRSKRKKLKKPPSQRKKGFAAENTETKAEAIDGETGPIHPEPTRSGKRYRFYWKHHGMVKGAAQWLEDISREEEFGIFAEADDQEIADEKQNLYGIRRRNAVVLELGTRGEKVAKFPATRGDAPWHGFPVYPLTRPDPYDRGEESHGRQGEENRPPKLIFTKMVTAGLIDARARTRLEKGD